LASYFLCIGGTFSLRTSTGIPQPPGVQERNQLFKTIRSDCAPTLRGKLFHSQTMPILDALLDPARPVFLFGSTPPREGTSIEKAKESCRKFAARSAVLATDGFIVYDIQDEGSRTTLERPFPFRRTMDPSLYASFFPAVSGKQCVVYKCVVEESMENFDTWMDKATKDHGHTAFNFVGAASSDVKHVGPSLQEAGLRNHQRENCHFGCVCIPERHTTKKNEDLNMFRNPGHIQRRAAGVAAEQLRRPVQAEEGGAQEGSADIRALR
jgi:hypothetical protein